MIKRAWLMRWRPSIFSKLLAIMLGMMAILLSMVAAFFALIVFPSTTSTAENSQGYYLAGAPGGAVYLPARQVLHRMRFAHVALLLMLLLLIVAVVSVAYWFQKRLLRPVQSLNDGVLRMSAGHLDILLPVFAHDELGALTEAFNNMVRRVKEMIQARDQLLLNVSHELRSPLTRMKVALALQPDEESKASLNADVNEMEIMLSELLEIERLRAPGGIARERQDLAPILREVAAAFENRPPGVQLTVTPQSIIVNIDRNKIRVVLRNLLENAFKYSFPDSHAVDLCAVETPDGVVIRVRDDGCGIPEAHMSNIFEPFFRLDPSRSKKTGGYGLGLSICKWITEAHAGTIQVEKNPVRGVLFTVTLPNARNNAGSPSSAPLP